MARSAPDREVTVATAISRLFCTVAWTRELHAPLEELQHTLHTVHAGAPLRWTAADDLHLTLRYYGDVGDAQALDLDALLVAQARLSPATTLDFECVELWPPARPRLLVACFEEAPALAMLQRTLEADAVARGFAPEPRAFRAHVTLARADGAWSPSPVRLKLAPFAVPADEIALWHSGLADADRRYAERLRRRLGADAPPP